MKLLPHSPSPNTTGTDRSSHRFGQQLRTSLIKDYYWHYIDYDGLKEALKKPKRKPTADDPSSIQWTNDDESAFVAQLESELDKVYTFQKLKADETVRRIRSSERDVEEVLGRSSGDDGEGKEDEDAYAEDYELLEQDLSDIIADVHDLAKYTQLNYTGFQKIIKKHDKLTGWHLKPAFAARLKQKAFFRHNYDSYIVKLSRLYDQVRTKGHPVKGDSAAGGSQQNFVRQTTKYWVHPENVTELKLIILKHLPVLVYDPNKEFQEADSAITSIYYDNPETWELYTGRLKKTEGAEAIRLRWYGGMDTNKIFIERKTHREDWTGEKSVKARVMLKEKYVNHFLSGKMTVDEVVEKWRKEGKKSEKDIQEDARLASEIQYRVISRHLVPVCRSFYHRTAFQLPGDARVRISLDTELSMVREDNLDGSQRAGSNWRRMDIGIDWPFSQLPTGDVELFPYAVLEVKIQTQEGQDPPQWIRDLIASHLVEAVPKFSKFIHGTVTMFPNRINLLPFWMPQMNVDIRKPITHRFGIERPGQSASYSTSDDPLDDESDFDDAEDTVTGSTTPKISDGEGEDQQMRRLRAAREAMRQHELDRDADDEEDYSDGNALDIEERVAAIPLAENPDDYPLYDSEEEDEADEMEAARRQGGWWYGWKLFQNHAKQHAVTAGNFLVSVFNTIKPVPRSYMPPGVTGPTLRQLGSQVQARKFKAPPGKRIHVPVRVEPKVYFANERTFLSWLEFSIILGSIAATLLNFGDNISIASAWAFTVVACLALLYSVGIYLIRVEVIRERRAGTNKYYDKWGPTLLCLGLVFAVAVNFVFTVKEKGIASDKKERISFRQDL